ncbi:App1 family protein [Spirosoma spitsbergense]|uniref:App1 family protein n=1 Tax=Spirosoma spitsbergense TaxID=431554 RepID=UPI000368DE82|nr:phosphatase domain-containing protein [Spirosoma spitsbergense]
MNKQKIGLKDKIKRFFLAKLRLSDQPVVRLYRGFGNDTQLLIDGHVFKRSALARNRYRNIDFVNLLAVLRLFLVKPYPNALVKVYFGEQVIETKANANGYFATALTLMEPLPPGWHRIKAQVVSQVITPELLIAEDEGKVLIPNSTPFICISDIDDTFLISHSSTIAKRLLVLLTENAHSRTPFDGVVAHYQLLAEAGANKQALNPFFYVSSSEWNLYSYILEFSQKNGLPEGVYRLSPLKRLTELLKTGRGKHHTKFDRIEQIIRLYPTRQFVLLGDDSQQDPVIYARIVAQFPAQIRCVYIRQIYAPNKTRTEQIVATIDAAGVACCYFVHSAEARRHSITIGLVQA